MRQARTVEIEAETLAEAEATGLDLSEVLETALRQRISGQTFVVKPDTPERRERARRWQEENRAALEAYNEHIKRRGVFGDTAWWSAYQHGIRIAMIASLLFATAATAAAALVRRRRVRRRHENKS